MTVLHIYDIAGVGKILCKELIDNDIFSVCHTRTSRDIFKYGDYYKQETIYHEGRTRYFFLDTFKLIKDLNPDILHFHGLDRYLAYFRIRYPKKKIIIHYHGGDIREQWKEKEVKYKFAHLVCVSTPDLLKGMPNKHRIIHIPNPIDRDLFKRKQPYINDTALYMRQHFNYQTESERLAIEICKEKELDLTILDRNKKYFPYYDFSLYLQDFEYLIDFKHGRNLKKYEFYGESEILTALSTTALQQLSLNGKVLHRNKGELTKFPSRHDSKNVVKQWIKIYEDLIS